MHGFTSFDEALRRWRLIVGAACATLVTGAALGVFAPRSHAGAAETPCAAGVAAPLVLVSRALVPVRAQVLRGFTVARGTDVTLSAPDGYAATQIAGRNAEVIRLTAPHAGAFAVAGTWTQQYTDDTGATLTCAATGSVTLHAGAGTPLTIRPPKAQVFPAGSHITTTQYDAPAIWTWACKAESDATPLRLSVRWEVDMRPLKPGPPSTRNGTFRFTKHAKSFPVSSADPCDVRQAGGVDRHLPHGTVLHLLMGGNYQSGNGLMRLLQRGGFRNATGSAAPLHLQLTFSQGPRTLLDVKLCSWSQTGFVVAKGKGVSCWWD